MKINLNGILDDVLKGNQETANPDESSNILERELCGSTFEVGVEIMAGVDMVGILNDFGFQYFELGRYKEAAFCYERSLQILRSRFGSEHPETTISSVDYSGIAITLSHAGRTHYEMGNYEKARCFYKKALEIRESIRESICEMDHLSIASDLNDLGIASNLNDLGSLYFELGRYKEAVFCYERSLQIHESIFGSEHPETATLLNDLGLMIVMMGNHEKAKPYLERALKIREFALGPQHPDTANCLNNLGVLTEVMGDHESAWAYLERACKIHQSVLGTKHPNTVKILKNLERLKLVRQPGATGNHQ